MSLNVMLLDTPDNPGFSRAVTAGLAAIDVDLDCFEKVETGLQDLRARIDNNSLPDAVLLGPELANPLSVARQVYRLVPMLSLVFATKADPITFKQHLSKAPMIGYNWTVLGSTQPDFAEIIYKRVIASRQRKRWRTAIYKVNFKLAHAAPRPQRQLHISERKLAHILRHASEAIIIMDLAGRIQAWNHGAQQLFTLSSADASGRLLWEIIDGKWKRKTRALIEGSTNARAVIAEEINCKLAGEERCLSLSLSVVTDDDQNHLALCANVRDITERRRQERAIRQYARNLEASNQKLEQYMYALTHDLKSPLVTIGGYAGRIAVQCAAGETGKIEQSVSRIQRAVAKMTTLIEDLLLFHRIGNVAAKRMPTDLNQSLRQILADLQEMIDQVGVTVSLGPLPTVSLTDSEVHQLFENLIGNAIKYACGKPGDTITIGAVERKGEHRVFVRDQGPGIAARYHKQIFNLFQRLEEDGRGSGIGLAIVAKLMAGVGGRVWVESEEGRGACFWLAFPKSTS